MPFLDHVRELRRRTIVCAAALLALFVPLWFARRFIVGILRRAIPPEIPAPQAIAGSEEFMTAMKLVFLSAVIIALPLIVSQVILFVLPALRPREKRALIGGLGVGAALFALGTVFAYFLMVPLTMNFLWRGEFLGGWAVPSPRLEYQVSLVLQILLAFGVAFELPLAVVVLVFAGVVSRRSLYRSIRYAIVGCFVIGAVLTPPDPGSQLMLSVPLCLLYVGAAVFCSITRIGRAD